MTNETVTHHSSWPQIHQPHLSVNAVPEVAEDWRAVTCGACRLERPMQEVPGRVEYVIPEHVHEMDKAFGAQDAAPGSGEIRETGQRIAAAETLLAGIEATYATLGENIEYLKERQREARAEREEVVRLLSGLRASQNAQRVAQVGSEILSPQDGSQGPTRYLVVQGARFGDVGTFVARFGESIRIEFPDGDQRTYGEHYLQRTGDRYMITSGAYSGRLGTFLRSQGAGMFIVVDDTRGERWIPEQHLQRIS